MIKRFGLLIFLLMALTLSACAALRPLRPAPTATPSATVTVPPPTATLPTTPTVPTPTPTPADPQQLVLARADEALRALQQNDMATLAALVHPQLGVRFSPYAYLGEDNLIFTAEQVRGLMQDPTVYLWGAYDGIGSPIELTYADYAAQFVYNADFLNAPERSLDERIGQGNTIDNIAQVYPQAHVVEYHFPGFDPQFEGMDWQSLRLVFVEWQGQWYLVAIVHDQWTI